MMRIVYVKPPGPGWAPLEHLAILAARLLNGQLHIASLTRRQRVMADLLASLPRKRGGEVCLIIAPQARHLAGLVDLTHLFKGDSYVAAWVIDSFWTESIPELAKRRRRGAHIDKYYIADAEFVDEWTRQTGLKSTWLPWGSDVLHAGSGDASRPVDCQRLGRMPEPWEDDTRTDELMKQRGLVYRGRPAFHGHAIADQAEVMASLRRTKFSLSFSNRVSPTWTSTTHEYLTGRWTDALACGASVIGMSPRCVAASELLWAEGLVELDDVLVNSGIAAAQEAVSAWTPALARLNYTNALRRLDWRWRLLQIAGDLGVDSPGLDAEIAAVRQAMRSPTAEI